MKLSETQIALMKMLKVIDASLDMVDLVMNSMETKTQQDMMIDSLMTTYKKRGKVTEQEIMKLVLMITH